MANKCCHRTERQAIAVIGPNGDQKDNTLGDYVPHAADSEKAWQQTANKTVVTVLGGLKAYAAQHQSRWERNDVVSAVGCEISLGPPDPEMLAEAVAQHKAAA